MKTLSPTVTQFLSLLRSSLWQTVDNEPFNGLLVNWDEIGHLAMQQTVGPLVFNATLHRAPDLCPPKAWILRAYSIIERTRRTHELLDAGVAETCGALSNVGFRPILLKGQAYARAYPEPTLRQCGDIDLYVGDGQFRQACLTGRELCWKCEERFIPDAKHYACVNKGIKIELHRVAARLPSPTSDRKFQQWSRVQLASGRNIMIHGEKIEIPTPLFDVLFVFMHLYYHFIHGGIGLRQVCDWIMLLHAHFGIIDETELESKLREFNLLAGWRKFAPIAVDYLGLPQKECPLYSPEYCGDADRIMSFILKEGNFGRGHQKPTAPPISYFPRKIYSFRSVTSRLFSKFWIDPRLVMRYICNYTADGTKRLIKETLKLR